jgi:hypothetical protein
MMAPATAPPAAPYAPPFPVFVWGGAHETQRIETNTARQIFLHTLLACINYSFLFWGIIFTQ